MKDNSEMIDCFKCLYSTGDDSFAPQCECPEPLNYKNCYLYREEKMIKDTILHKPCLSYEKIFDLLDREKRELNDLVRELQEGINEKQKRLDEVSVRLFELAIIRDAFVAEAK